MTPNLGQKRFRHFRSPILWVTVIAAAYFFFTAVNVAHKRPWVDEGWFTGPALNLVTHGSFGTLLLDPAGSHLSIFKPGLILSGLNRHTYWVMPLYLLQLALWGKIFGFSVFSMRIPSVLWGAVSLCAVSVIIRRLYPVDRLAAFLGAAVLAVDFAFVGSATDGRMDMMCLGLGLAGLASYLVLHEKSFVRAVLISHSFTAAGCVTHPFGILALITLVFTMVFLDRSRLRPRIAIWSASPYAVAGAIWAIDVVRAPRDFFVQFTANSAGRMTDLLKPWSLLWDEINTRFALHYWRTTALSGRLRLTGLVLALVAIAILMTARCLRRRTGSRLLVRLVGLRFVLLCFIANPKFEHYIVYIVPFFAMAIGIAVSYFWNLPYAAVPDSLRDRRPTVSPRAACVAALAFYFASQTGVMIHRAFIIRGYENEYRPLIAYLRATMRPDDLIVGSAELGFGLGFYNPQLIDDVWLGYWSRRQPSVVVVDQWYYGGVFEGASARGLPTPNYFYAEFRRRFYKVKQIGGYSVYRRYQGR